MLALCLKALPFRLRVGTRTIMHVYGENTCDCKQRGQSNYSPLSHNRSLSRVAELAVASGKDTECAPCRQRPLMALPSCLTSSGSGPLAFAFFFRPCLRSLFRLCGRFCCRFRRLRCRFCCLLTQKLQEQMKGRENYRRTISTCKSVNIGLYKT